jgi:hypothetical protein
VKCADCRGVVEGLEPGGDEAWSRGVDTGRAERRSLTVSDS